MFSDLKMLQTASALARHSAERHAQIAENIANADTPGFKAKDLEPFSEAYARTERQTAMQAPGSSFAQNAFNAKRITIDGVTSPDGNTVSLEDQVTRSTAAVRNHDTAISIYTKALSMMRTALGTRG